MNVAIIPARGGSKRIPKKNIKQFLGKPIIAYSIETALASCCIDRVIVSTDDKEIADIAKSFGAEIPFVRPSELSDDHAGTIPVIKHAIEYIQQDNEIKYVCCIYATAPFLTADSIQKGFEALQEYDCDYAFSVTEYSFPIQRAIEIDGNGRAKMFQPEHRSTRSQDLPTAYHDAGQFYWGKSLSFTAEKPIMSDGSIPIILPRVLTQDIDTQEDWMEAEIKYSGIYQRV